MQDGYKKFYVGINVFVIRQGKLLLGKRKTVFGAGTWGLPGGHLEDREEMTVAAARELKEETGLQARQYVFSNIVNQPNQAQHYIQIGFIAYEVEGEPELMEPDRCEQWEWFLLDKLPTNIFPPHLIQIQNFINNNLFSEKTG